MTGAAELLGGPGGLGASTCLRKLFMDRRHLYAYAGYESQRGQRPEVLILPLDAIAAIRTLPNPVLCQP